jgi:hypothetical protein
MYVRLMKKYMLINNRITEPGQAKTKRLEKPDFQEAVSKAAFCRHYEF